MPNSTTGHGSGEDIEFLARYKAGQYIYRRGDTGKEMFIVKEGVVAVVNEKDKKYLARLEEGDFFGETAIFEDLPRLSTVKAETDCQLLRVNRTTFSQLSRYNPEIPIRMLRKLLRRLRNLQTTGTHVALDAPDEFQQESDNASGSSAPAGRGRIIHTLTGREFPLSGTTETIIGRIDPVSGFEPHIELKEVDPERSTSRRHAHVTRRGDGYFIQEEIGVTNGTFVNGVRLSEGEEVELHDGDRIRFGVVDTVFRSS